MKWITKKVRNKQKGKGRRKEERDENQELGKGIKQRIGTVTVVLGKKSTEEENRKFGEAKQNKRWKGRRKTIQLLRIKERDLSSFFILI